MHRKKKIPVGFIVTFVAAFMLALLLTALLAKFKPDMAQFMGMIFFGSWLLLSFIGVGIVALAKKKNREAYKNDKVQNTECGCGTFLPGYACTAYYYSNHGR